MTRQEFITKLEELLEVSSGTLSGETILGNNMRWDSLVMVGFMALVDENMGFAPAPRDIVQCRTVDDLVRIVSSGITD